MSGVSIRPAKAADMVMVAQMVRELAAEADAPLIPSVTPAQLANGMLSSDPRLEILVAEDGDGIGGMIIAFPVYSTWWGKRGLYVCDLYVAPRLRRRGLSVQLLRAALAGGDFSYVKLEVDRRNAAANALYEKLGFRGHPDDRTLRLSPEATLKLRQSS